MKNGRVSLSQIAQQLGVSVSTVSRALNHHPAISQEITDTVNKLAKELNYVPNRMALSLKNGRLNTLGVIVPMISRHFISSVIEGIEDYAFKHGYDIIIFQSKNSFDIERRLVSSISGRVDGVLVSLASHNESHDYFNSLTVPLVQFDRVDSSINSSTVTIDDYAGARIAVEHLLSQGFRRIFHFSGPSHINVWRNRKLGYIETMAKHNIDIEENWIYEAPTIESEGAKFVQQILSSGVELPDAIFSSGDYSAFGIIHEFKKHGIEMPIVGFANEPFCNYVTPTLSSVNQFSHRMGSIACKALLDILEGQPASNTIITPELVVRESSLRTR